MQKVILVLILSLFPSGCASKFVQSEIVAVEREGCTLCAAKIEYDEGRYWMKMMKYPEVGETFKMYCEGTHCEIKGRTDVSN